MVSKLGMSVSPKLGTGVMSNMFLEFLSCKSIHCIATAP